MFDNTKDKNFIEKTSKSNNVIRVLSFFFIPLMLFILMEHLLSTELVSSRIDAALFYLNYLFWLLLFLFFFLLAGSIRWATVIQAVIMFVLGLTDHFLMIFRGAPLQPWDIYSISTAISVSDNYSFSLLWDIPLIFIGFVLVIFWACRIDFRINRSARGFFFLRVIPAIVTAVIIFLFSLMIRNDDFVRRIGFFDWMFFQSEMTERNGIALTFLYDAKFLKVNKPEGYSAEKARELLADTSDKDVSITSAEEIPNIVVVMNEAFSDLSILGDFSTNKDLMPFMHSMQKGRENTISGYLKVPVIGGNTANTEFEFLTHNSMACLNGACVPYQQFINHRTESLASNLAMQGYTTVALHPYGKRGWKRDKVYEYLGFDSFLSEEDFTDSVLVREYISDKSDYDKVIDIFENKEESPIFIFNITMQNHGAYKDRYDNFVPDVSADVIDDVEFNQYISLVRLSDDETSRLVDYFADVDEPVIVVFFGDHQPADIVVEELYDQMGKNVYDLSPEEKEIRYKVPFFIWANYDIPEETSVESTPYYLSVRLLELAGRPLSDYELFVNGVQNEKYNDTERRIVQYYKMFDEKNDKQ